MHPSKVKGQSAMEYLMTYGWTILIVAVVLVVLFGLGVFSLNTSNPTACVVIPGYSCTTPVLSSNGLLILNFGQLGQAIKVTGTLCTQSTTSTGQSFTSVGPYSLGSGQTASLPFSCQLSGSTVGTKFSGYLWIQYTVSGSAQTYTQRFAAIRAAASSVGSTSAPNVQFAYNSMVGTNGLPINVITTGGSPTLWLCGAAEDAGSGGAPATYVTSYTTIDAADADTFSTVVGRQSTNGCRFGDPDGYPDFAEVAIGVTNSITPVVTSNSANGASTMNVPISISSVQAPAVAVVIVACTSGGNGGNNLGHGATCDPNGSESITVPSQCAALASPYYVDGDGEETAAAYSCTFSTAGTYIVSVTVGSNQNMDAAAAAYVFG